MEPKAIPERLLAGIDRWVICGIRPGGFLTAVLSNDLRGAYQRGDSEALDAMQAIIQFMYSEAPSTCWGSESIMTTWRDTRNEQGPYSAWAPFSFAERARRIAETGGHDEQHSD